ncbi:hypothetical protein [Curtobacterium sp. MCBA15_013]|uniref:hypothetical protein n=1 Tax=Curtobacterium sp. MCBA15_013 TaxID=1898739 RepID=UPI0008DD59E8|nr:hypothetical protein [Curtobacterium sp. MCBA15_013]OII18419.1 hypothetical protein BIV01_02415 [Curtobacterium sp. MCBA15_013]
MQERTWFSGQRSDGSMIATVMDDIDVTIDRGGLITINGPAGGCTTVEFDDAVPLIAALTEGVQILRDLGHTERTAIVEWMREHETS